MDLETQIKLQVDDFGAPFDPERHESPPQIVRTPKGKRWRLKRGAPKNKGFEVTLTNPRKPRISKPILPSPPVHESAHAPVADLAEYVPVVSLLGDIPQVSKLVADAEPVPPIETPMEADAIPERAAEVVSGNSVDHETTGQTLAGMTTGMLYIIIGGSWEIEGAERKAHANAWRRIAEYHQWPLLNPWIELAGIWISSAAKRITDTESNGKLARTWQWLRKWTGTGLRPAAAVAPVAPVVPVAPVARTAFRA